MSDLAKERIERHKRKRKPEEKEQESRTGGQALNLLLADEEEIAKDEEEKKQAQTPQISIHLKDDLPDTDPNWTKLPNDIYTLSAEKLDTGETVLYFYLYGQSFGLGRNYCRHSHKATLEYTSIKSMSTARRSLSGLIEKKFIIRALEKDAGRHNITKEGGLYRILTPSEISDGAIEEGLSIQNIPADGMFYLSMSNLNTVQ
jgi:hypothetical protein